MQGWGPGAADTIDIFPAQTGRVAAIALLICAPPSWHAQRGADVHAVDDGGRTALIYAVWKGSLTCVEALLAAGASANVVEAGPGMTPLILAATEGHTALVAPLLVGRLGRSCVWRDAHALMDPMPCHAMSCRVSARCRHDTPCHAMPCHAMPCHAMPCHAGPSLLQTRHALHVSRLA